MYAVRRGRSRGVTRRGWAVVRGVVAATLLLAGGSHPGPAHAALQEASGGQIPRPDHVLVVMEENQDYSTVIGSGAAPYIDSLAARGALFTDSHGIGHPSEPNYLEIFAGTNEGLSDDSCPHSYSGANLGSELLAARRGFTGYSESLPGPGAMTCVAGAYARKHAPWVNFSNVPAAANQPFSAFPSDFSRLPAVSFLVPNVLNDMHDGSVAQGDSWLRQHLGAYVQWAQTHNSLLILQWDEDSSKTSSNHIPTVFVGPMVAPGRYGEHITHLSILRTLEDMYGLGYAGASGSSATIQDVWTAPGAQGDVHLFPQTGHTVRGRFWTYWQTHGGLLQQGYPLSEEVQGVSPQNGHTYTMQYFERAVFEYHPENAPPADVLLRRLGAERYAARYPQGAPGQVPNTANGRFFPETGHTLGGNFRTYWEAHGGLAQQGYPLSDEFTEVSPTDGKSYTVQYFERAVFEWHPANPDPYKVLLSLLGRLAYKG